MYELFQDYHSLEVKETKGYKQRRIYLKRRRVAVVIKEMKIGNSTIRIHDDCMAKTPEENQKIMDRIAELVGNHYKLKAKCIKV